MLQAYGENRFQSTRLSRASTIGRLPMTLEVADFNPQGSREPRLKFADIPRLPSDFNPQGSREPRLSSFSVLRLRNPISIHKALASLDHEGIRKGLDIAISIHKALASLDGKNAQLFLHLCHIYMLHIIHLLQIVYQVEISSRNLIVFSGQL